jgi:SAM-dependent methyltransferase
MPDGTHTILETRSLARDHRRLAELLAPGFAVLDVGCGSGAITRDMAEAVGPAGHVVGLDADDRLIAGARRTHAGVTHLSFEVGDAYALPYRGTFDVVTAARVLQWLADPLGALSAMARASRPGGRVVVLDYNHQKIAWRPQPPPSMRAFHAAFLRWRAEAGMDNAIADRLVELFGAVGLVDVTASPQPETTRRADPGFEGRAGIWAEVASSRGRQMVADGAVTERQRATAEREYRAWIRDEAESQTMYLLAVDGVSGRRAALP